MKPAPFAYDRADSLEHALALLADHGGDARVLAGGQSLVPLLNLRVARPARLVDITRLDALRRLGVVDGALHIGALVPHAALEHHEVVRAVVPVLAQAAAHIGHPAIRTRGTIGGSLAHGDPSAELIAATAALDATVVLDSRRGRREVPVADLVAGPYETVVAPDELLTWVRIPLPDAAARSGFYEIAPREGDFAVVGAVWHASPVAASAAVFGADTGHVRARLGADGGWEDAAERIVADAALAPLTARRVRVALRRAAEAAA